MGLQIDHELYRWLVSLEVIEPSNKHRLYGNEKCELDEILSKNFMNGIKFADLLKQLIILSEDFSSTLVNLDNLKDNNNSSTRLYNWNILSENFFKINIIVDNDLKNLLVAGLILFLF